MAGAGFLLEGLTLEVGPGETIAFRGPSGCGKSTLLLAMAGLHPLSAGTIFIAGKDIRTLGEEDLRQKLTLVPQRSVIMAGSVRESLCLAAPHSSEGQMWQVLDCVRLAGLVRARGGLDLTLGHLGEGLSGGEVRRLALARALLRRPEILLLDEPTEGLDEKTAAEVLGAIRDLLPRAAIVMASHRAVEQAFAQVITLTSKTVPSA
nr:ATP-binding cassette domain-containing protein [Rhizobium sp. SSA_523]